MGSRQILVVGWLEELIEIGLGGHVDLKDVLQITEEGIRAEPGVQELFPFDEIH